jgi:hypothetical protein
MLGRDRCSDEAVEEVTPLRHRVGADLREGVRKSAAARLRHNLRHSDTTRIRMGWMTGFEPATLEPQSAPSVVTSRHHTPRVVSWSSVGIVLRERAWSGIVRRNLGHNSDTRRLAWLHYGACPTAGDLKSIARRVLSRRATPFQAGAAIAPLKSLEQH